jgi:hypothetical protein
MGTGVSFPGVKRSGRGVGQPTPSNAEAEERVDLHTSIPPLDLNALFLPATMTDSTDCCNSNLGCGRF